MAQAGQILIASVALIAFVWAIWSISKLLTRSGYIVRPVSMMDHRMTEIERRHRERIQASKE